jgi:ArsR family transcriptional regulator
MKTRLPVIQPDLCCDVPVEPAAISDERRQRVLAVFKALADGTRFDVFRLIAAQPEPICACDIVDRFDVSQPTIAHHLKVLREAGLITVSRQGVWAYYAVEAAGIDLLDSTPDLFAASTGDLALTG